MKMPKYVLLTFTKGQVFAFTNRGLWSVFHHNQLRMCNNKGLIVKGYRFIFQDFDGNLEPWVSNKEVTFSVYATVEDYEKGLDLSDL